MLIPVTSPFQLVFIHLNANESSISERQGTVRQRIDDNVVPCISGWL